MGRTPKRSPVLTRGAPRPRLPIGVRRKGPGRWEARRGAHRYSLGTYDTAEEAARASDRAAIHFYGDAADTNFGREQYTHDPVLTQLKGLSKEQFVVRLRGVAPGRRVHKIETQRKSKADKKTSSMLVNRDCTSPSAVRIPGEGSWAWPVDRILRRLGKHKTQSLPTTAEAPTDVEESVAILRDVTQSTDSDLHTVSNVLKFWSWWLSADQAREDEVVRLKADCGLFRRLNATGSASWECLYTSHPEFRLLCDAAGVDKIVARGTGGSTPLTVGEVLRAVHYELLRVGGYPSTGPEASRPKCVYGAMGLLHEKLSRRPTLHECRTEAERVMASGLPVHAFFKLLYERRNFADERANVIPAGYTLDLTFYRQNGEAFEDSGVQGVKSLRWEDTRKAHWETRPVTSAIKNFYETRFQRPCTWRSLYDCFYNFARYEKAQLFWGHGFKFCLRDQCGNAVKLSELDVPAFKGLKLDEAAFGRMT